MRKWMSYVPSTYYLIVVPYLRLLSGFEALFIVSRAALKRSIDVAGSAVA